MIQVWHNYGFDRHVLFNEGIDAQGLGADTMHMARIWDTNRLTRGGYGLEDLSRELLGSGEKKVGMREIFGTPKLKKVGFAGGRLSRN